MSTKREKEKAQQIQVFVRSRPINKLERDARSLSSVEIMNSKELAVKQQHNKKYSFDRVFGPYAKQIEVYMTVVNPLIAEVLAGYNCTVFAYGQTGTGKTYTMAGGSVFSAGLTWQDDVNAGIIPRALAHLFDELRLISQEYTVRVSYLELYNEELNDLLSDTDDGNRIRLFEDQRQKGSVIIQGIEEQTVHSKNEVYRILEKGQEKRRTASTLMNAQSSRSHTVFSITVHTRENNIDGEELVKTGKLNLVDLAGSENISRSGAVDARAREAGNINQSLLTLGRVIKALVERCPHIPYRESKLTRILQDSLGGRTKTSIIATISPASSCLEETLSTLEYANRARNIINRPEVNQKMCQKLLISQYTDEIERLKRDLTATRSGTAICLAPDNYERLVTDNEIQKEELAEKINLIRSLEQQLKNIEEQKEAVEFEWNRLRHSFDETRRRLQKCHHKLKETVTQKKEQEYLATYYEKDAGALHKQAEAFLDFTENSTKNETILRSKIETLRNHGNTNISTFKEATDVFGDKCKVMMKDVVEYSRYCSDAKDNLLDMLLELRAQQLKSHQDNMAVMKKFMEQVFNSVNTYNGELDEERVKADSCVSNFVDQCQRQLIAVNKHYEQKMEGTYKCMESMLICNQEGTETFCSEIRDKLHKVTSEMDVSNENTKNDINKIADEIQQRLDKLVKSLTNQNEHFDSINNQIHTNRQDLIALINSQYDNLERDLNKGRQFNNEAGSCAFSIDHTIAQQISELNNKIEHSSKSNRDNSTELLNIIDKNKQEQMVNTTKLLENLHREIIEDQFVIEKCRDIISNVESEGCNLTQHNSVIQAKLRTLLNSNSEDVRTFMNQQIDANGQSSSKFELNIDNVSAKLTELDTSTTHITNILSNNLHQCQEDLHNCVENKLVDVKPNGDTPVRLNFNYPKSLKQPSPKESLLSRFRQQFKNQLDISGISLDSESFLDSSHSGEFSPVPPD